MRPRLAPLLAVVLAVVASGGAEARRRARASGVEVARVGWVDEAAERADPAAPSVWRRLVDSDPVHNGDRVRTAPTAVVRLDFPWMRVTLAPSTILAIPARVVLSTLLEQGRAEFEGEGRDIVKIEVGQAEIRGGGRLVVRREGTRTSATALAGAFRIAAVGRSVEIRAGEGTTVTDGQPPLSADPLPAAPQALLPGVDPVYVPSGQAVELRWSPAGRSHHVQILPVEGDDVLLARDVAAPPYKLDIPWLGTYRWRVAIRDARGLESRPSADGLVCVVDR